MFEESIFLFLIICISYKIMTLFYCVHYVIKKPMIKIRYL